VVVHELCHLRWHGHGPRFWDLVRRQMPDFERHRAWLRRNGAARPRVAVTSRGASRRGIWLARQDPSLRSG
ncbi:MAG: M48 metallopeptidase family protein, partial [Gammaproteobacteria bacterium]